MSAGPEPLRRMPVTPSLKHPHLEPRPAPQLRRGHALGPRGLWPCPRDRATLRFRTRKAALFTTQPLVSASLRQVCCHIIGSNVSEHLQSIPSPSPLSLFPSGPHRAPAAGTPCAGDLLMPTPTSRPAVSLLRGLTQCGCRPHGRAYRMPRHTGRTRQQHPLTPAVEHARLGVPNTKQVTLRVTRWQEPWKQGRADWVAWSQSHL